MDTGLTSRPIKDDRLPANIRLSFTRDGSVWARFGTEHAEPDWIYEKESRLSEQITVLPREAMDFLESGNFTQFCALTDLDLKIKAERGWHPSYITMYDPNSRWARLSSACAECYGPLQRYERCRCWRMPACDTAYSPAVPCGVSRRTARRDKLGTSSDRTRYAHQALSFDAGRDSSCRTSRRPTSSCTCSVRDPQTGSLRDALACRCPLARNSGRSQIGFRLADIDTVFFRDARWPHLLPNGTACRPGHVLLPGASLD